MEHGQNPSTVHEQPGPSSATQNKPPVLDTKEQMRKNKELFSCVRSDVTENEKTVQLEKLLKEGAGVNARDENDDNNTPLHMAVKKGELEVVDFLLANKADANAINLNGHLPIDLTELEEIREKMRQRHSEIYYKKRGGTSAIEGHFYETKLLALFLLTAQESDDIEQFYLGSNVYGTGAYDDIVCRYNLAGLHAICAPRHPSYHHLKTAPDGSTTRVLLRRPISA